ncbi:MAG: metallophosphoesterase family protein [Thermoplasmata archaeon]
MFVVKIGSRFTLKRVMRNIALLGIGIILCTALLPTVSSVSANKQDRWSFVIGAVGDVCGTHLAWNNPQRHQYDDVANLLYSWDLDKFLMLGDAQHEDGLLEDYYKYYDVEFGKLLPITCPVPGNHDYYWDGWPANNPHSASNGSGYFGYFGDIACPPLGFYSFDLGNWHLIALNSPLMFDYDYSEVGTPTYVQYEWLRQDLAAHPEDKYPGTIVYFHHPLYDWETPGSPQWASPELIPYWDLLYSSGVDIILNGHAHNYQRWGPQDAYGNYATDGIREFVVGTGGYYLNNLGHPPKPANFEWGQDWAFGALRLTLHDGYFDFEYISLSGIILDSSYGVPCN